MVTLGAGLDPSRAHLFGHLSVIEAAVRATVDARRTDDPQPDDPFRGLYVSDDHVDLLLAGAAPEPAEVEGARQARERIEADADAAEAGGHLLRLRHLARSFGLVPADVDILLVAMAPDLDSRFEKLYGYLNDDVTRRRATVGLALELAGLAALDSAIRARVLPGCPMVDGGLLVLEEADRPFLTRSLRVPDRVTAHLLGGDEPDVGLLHCLADLPPLPARAGPGEVAVGRALRHGASLVHLHEKPGAASRMAAVVALREAGLGAVVLDLHRLAPDEDMAALARVASREARLRGAGLVVGPLEVVTGGDPSVAGAKARTAAAVRHLAEVACPAILYSRGTWDPAWSRGVALNVEAPSLDRSEREAAWRLLLDGDADPGLDPAESTAHFRLAPEHIVRATTAARNQATLHGGPVRELELRGGARAQNAAGLEHLARRVEPRVGWVDLVLPPNVFSHLHELVARARNRPKVLEEWNLRPGGGRGRGIAALFAGDSGTGKTMSAEVVAFELGLDLYTVNLATVVDKYVGETEKNLERIFSEADGVNG
ncbi:MAG: AAA family ATPase, partial [Acidimicrobiales bacterium]